MKSVFLCTFLLSLVQYGIADTICNRDVSYSSTLITPCIGNDVAVLWPNYQDLTTYYKCNNLRIPELQSCPPKTYFTYYFQKCTDCSSFIPPPQCEFLKETTDVTCVSNKPPTTSKPPKTTTTKAPKTTTTSEKPTEVPPIVPTPPSETPSSSTEIPMPPMVVTPVPGIPTPPNENVTPPSIPGIPPLLTTVASP